MSAHERLEVGIIGLGKFGLHLGRELVTLGHHVVGLDSNEQQVKNAQDVLSKVYAGDATDKTVLDQLRFQDFSVVAVSVGKSMETSILTAFNLQELGVKKIIAKATSPEHRKILQRLGVRQIIQPEIDVALQTALRLDNPGMLDFLPLGGGIMLQEFTVDAWEGKTLIDLKLMSEYGILVVAVKAVNSTDYVFVPNPLTPFHKGDKLVCIGKREAVQEVTS